MHHTIVGVDTNMSSHKNVLQPQRIDKLTALAVLIGTFGDDRRIYQQRSSDDLTAMLRRCLLTLTSQDVSGTRVSSNGC